LSHVKINTFEIEIYFSHVFIALIDTVGYHNYRTLSNFLSEFWYPFLQKPKNGKI